MALILPPAIDPLSCPMPILSVRHVTTYRYRQPVAFGEHRITFRPRDSYDQRLIEASIAIVPEPASLHWVHDVFGNCVAVARFAGRAEELRFDCRIRLDHTPINALDFQLEDHARRYPFAYGAEDIPDLTRSIERQYLDPNREIDHWVRRFLRQSGPKRKNRHAGSAGLDHQGHPQRVHLCG